MRGAMARMALVVSGAGARLAEVGQSLDVGAVYRLSPADVVSVPLRLLGLTPPRRAQAHGDRLVAFFGDRPCTDFR